VWWNWYFRFVSAPALPISFSARFTFITKTVAVLAYNFGSQHVYLTTYMVIVKTYLRSACFDQQHGAEQQQVATASVGHMAVLLSLHMHLHRTSQLRVGHTTAATSTGPGTSK
jgi:hypothetical protein